MRAGDNIKISVRNLVEFIERSGNLDNTKGGMKEADAMKLGASLHRKIQKRMPVNYRAEVSLKYKANIVHDNISFDMLIEGRADGIVPAVDVIDTLTAVIQDRNYTVIDEIKCVLRDVNSITEAVKVHKSQAMCYAYMYYKSCIEDNPEYEIANMGIRITYCSIETEQIKYFDEVFSTSYLEKWFDELIHEYAKWAIFQKKWFDKRNASIKKLEFPFDYRPGQKELVAGVYRTIIRSKKLYIQAPTGVGKTISTVFPTIKAIGEDEADKIFYLTAKTITRTAAEDTFSLLSDRGVEFKTVTLTAKEKLCVLDKPDCNPISCNRAAGHYDRVNDAVFDLISNENTINRDVINEYAERYCVCPFEMALDVSLWTDAVICDYNYAFDPNVYLRRFFEAESNDRFVFLIDEAHNLVDRANEMYSAILVKEDLMNVKRLVTTLSPGMVKALSDCNKDMLALKRECDDFEVYRDFGVCGSLILHLLKLMSVYEEFLNEYSDFEGRVDVLNLYFEIRNFVSIYENIDDDYLIYTDYDSYNNFRIKLTCMNPARNLLVNMSKAKSAVLFSATFLPINYYKEQLAGSKDDYAIYADSPFDYNNRLVMIGRDVSTKYTRRNEREYKKIARYICSFVNSRVGNYMVFFPSYSYMENIYEVIDESIRPAIDMQTSNMTEEMKEEYLNSFNDDAKTLRIGFCVMGGIFSEGIDLKHDRLIGVVIVGTGLPMVCNERELYRGYFDEINNKGFDYAYLYSGMNKVLQSSGRVIRTCEDVGAILLLDDRFMTPQYYQLFPREWKDIKLVNEKSVEDIAIDFWKNR